MTKMNQSVNNVLIHLQTINISLSKPIKQKGKSLTFVIKLPIFI